ncbi:hypothetical protein [Archaeoglobus neptunius]|uniref:hypothetical protein n=1 Tax=Archaeoglobus neptunius TaxID=2798580 RepID=UPI0019255D62|nr:hypothetical protein [Archaeoglobus neptunius]
MTGRVGLNINGDLSRSEIAARARIAESSGVKIIWIGEFEGFDDPFEVAEIISKEVRINIGFGVISAQRRCDEIVERLKDLCAKYGERYVLGLGAGRADKPQTAFKRLKRCIEELRSSVPYLVVGAGSPGTVRLSSSTDGVLFNSVNPEFVNWLRRYLVKDVFKASYGPALITPSENEEDLLIAASIVFLGSKRLISEFGFENLEQEISKANLTELISLREAGRSIRDCETSDALFKHRDFLLNNFTICGDLESFILRLKELLKVTDHVVLSDPFFRDLNAMRLLGDICRVVG